ncbi:hypothetical protein QYE76_052090 [Lolium multiflorum]|uniref:CCHC-type domain-containing protein n=1 Tax=Lolium multiflorum TaxID=4521 RepID=A0AAD8STB4_LOLMU|nr:hypothetical protein QYE76_052090 [Lolium multiflorum]
MGNNGGNNFRRPFRQQFNGNNRNNGFNNGGYRNNGRGRSPRPPVNRNGRNPPAAIVNQQGAQSDVVDTTALRKSAVVPVAAGSAAVQKPVSMDDSVGDAERSSKGVKADKTLCFRCDQNGHRADACTAVLCVYCERATHASKDCHLLNMPKPTPTIYGICRAELRIYDVPASDELKFKHDSGKVARIKVDGGVLSADQVISELGWIVPGEHQWSLEKVEDNVFKTVFPMKVDLARLVKICSVPIDAVNGLFLLFEEWSSGPVDKFKLEEAWVCVHGLPQKLRSLVYNMCLMVLTIRMIEGYKTPNPADEEMEEANGNGEDNPPKEMDGNRKHNVPKEAGKDVAPTPQRVATAAVYPTGGCTSQRFASVAVYPRGGCMSQHFAVAVYPTDWST